MYDLIVFAIFIAISITLFFLYAVSRRKAIRLASELLTAQLDNSILKSSIQKLVDEQSIKSIEQTDGFLNFVSQSRDWAFAYIEDLQNSLGSFDKKLSESFEYANTYGTLQPGPLLDIINGIEAEYREIKRFLPDKDANV